jgi:hypothetical protein
VGNLLRSLLGPRESVRANETTPVSITDWARQFRPGSQATYLGRKYQGFTTTGTAGTGLYEGNSVVFACEVNRLQVFSEARFQFRALQSGRPGDLFGTPDLAILEVPWPGATTRDLLIQAELDITTCGNSYWVLDDGVKYSPRRPAALVRLDPLHVRYITEAYVDPVSGYRVGEQLIGYAYVDGRDVTIYTPHEVAHYKPVPSGCQWVGQSWLSACLPDVEADAQLTSHKLTTLRQGANLGVVVSLDAAVTPEQFREFVAEFREAHEGPENAGKTVFFGGGADAKTVGQTFENLALAATQGATETRIAACAMVPPALVGLSEGLAGAAGLNTGTYQAAKRKFVDATMRPNWGSFCGAFQVLVAQPRNAAGQQIPAQLWYDDRDIPFLREDVLDAATILTANATSINQLITAGFDADAVVKAVSVSDVRGLLGQHSGLYSVQLQPAGSTPTPPGATP